MYRKYLLAVLLILFAVNVTAQEKKEEAAPPKAPKAIEIKDIVKWKGIRSSVLSSNGEWFAYYIVPQEGDGEIIIRKTKEEKEYKFPTGDASSFGNAAFSDDGRWAAFVTSPKFSEAKNLRKQKKTIYSGVTLVNLSSGEKKEFEKVRGFRFSNENPDWIVLSKYPPEGQTPGKDKPTGNDIVLRELSTGKEFNIGNVASFSFNKKGTYLAMIIDANDMAGNGVLLRDMKTGIIHSLESDKAIYRSLTWTENGEGFAFLKGVEDKKFEEKVFSIIGFKNIGEKTPGRFEFNPKEEKTFPEGMGISTNGGASWNSELTLLSFGIAEQKKKENAEEPKDAKDKPAAEEKKDAGVKENPQAAEAKKDEPKKEDAKKKPAVKVEDDELPGLVIWHWQDKRLQAQQQVNEPMDKNYTYYSIYNVADKKFMRLANDSLRRVSIPEKADYAIGFDNTDYELYGNLDGRNYNDIYVINLATGEKKLALKQNRWSMGVSPDAKYLLYFEDGHYYTYEVKTDSKVNITKDIPVSFVNVEDDHNVKNPPVYPVGWSKDGKTVLLSDLWDVWGVPSAGGEGVNITLDGRKEQIKYQRRIILDYEEKGIDLSKPLYFMMYGEWTKKGGIAQVNYKKPGAKPLLWDDAFFSTLIKAKNSEVYLYTKETTKEAPEYYSAGPDLSSGKKLTNIGAQQKDYLWSDGAVLVNYKSDKGVPLQAALFLPANYEKGKSYPTIVYYYEKMSQTLNQYNRPSANGFNKSYYTSQGYAVLMPDIVYQLNDPGMSAVWCVIPAVKAAIETGIIDKDRIGIQGHSWGGYQTAFLITQTNMFKAAVAGAPLTNMVSMYNLIYWNSGSGNMAIFESSQGRFTGSYLDNFDAYIRNSPVFHAKNVTTPLVILHNDKDGAVDWTQGIEYYSTLRRLQKPVVMLQYKGENHGLAKTENQRDYTVRMKEFFDHYLIGKPMPGWYSKGISNLQLKDHLKERVKDLKEKIEAGN